MKPSQTPARTGIFFSRAARRRTVASVSARLIPLGGAAGGGSQVSLPALQLIGVSLTDLPTVEVYAG